MKDDLDILRKSDELRDLMVKHLGIRAKSFERACKRAGRRLPRRLRGAAGRIAEAQQMAQNPKLQRYMDAQALNTDYAALRDWLVAKDLAEERKTKRLNLAALIAFQVLLVFAMVIAFLSWRGVI